MSGYQVLAKREIPEFDVSITLTGKVVRNKNVHGGERAVSVRLQSGYSAWGFGSTWEAAEQSAVLAAGAIA